MPDPIRAMTLLLHVANLLLFDLQCQVRSLLIRLRKKILRIGNIFY